MEALNNIPVAVGFGILIGLVVGWMIKSGSGGKSEQALQQSKDEMEQYRKEVTAHFEKTAKLVGAMTEQYRAVYDHLSDGAQKLCNDPTARLDAIGQGEALIAAHIEPAAGQNAKPVAEARREQPTAASSADETVADAESLKGKTATPGKEARVEDDSGATEKRTQTEPEERTAT
ncbi:MAG: DUF1043 family protein [Gammaproteobacteria bacterium]|nr:DUF1043 family protein [Gammaproteobacteria bacterium]